MTNNVFVRLLYVYACVLVLVLFVGIPLFSSGCSSNGGDIYTKEVRRKVAITKLSFEDHTYIQFGDDYMRRSVFIIHDPDCVKCQNTKQSIKVEKE